MTTFTRFFTAIAMLAFAVAANAQLIDKKSLTLEAAQKIATASLVEARANNWNVIIAVVDEGGHLITLNRMETAQYGSIDVAIGKAKTAAAFRRPTKVLEDVAKTRPTLSTIANAYLLEGGVPIIYNGQVIGAVGVSGATSQQDAQVAEAGINSLGLAK
ncbi:MAG: heme-binding protein [Betaproteobacteria bacterium]|jgi:glc operon protein GlcG